MYITIHEAHEVADALRAKELEYIGDQIADIADEAVRRYGGRASVSIDPSAAVGYVLPKDGPRHGS